VTGSSYSFARHGSDIVEGRGEAGFANGKELTGGRGAHSVINAVGIEESFVQAISTTRGGGHIGFAGIAHEGVKLPMDEVFFAEVHLHGGPAPARR
jgi:threonine dehydrogenase-like Zn-dependent dehydrogenase